METVIAHTSDRQREERSDEKSRSHNDKSRWDDEILRSLWSLRMT